MNQTDLDLLNEIADHFDGIGDGAPDSSHAAIFANQHEQKLRALIRRARMEADGITEEDIEETRMPTHWPENR